MPNNAFNTAGLPVSTDEGAVGSATPEPAMVPPQLEGFQVHGLLGQGGMGSVWAAVQLSTGRSVALKLMRGGAFGSVRARARFDREIELLSRLDHPNIARLYQSGTHQGLYFYAMERVDGLPLNQYVRDQRLSTQQLLGLMEIICRAVDHAHRRGVIHRDLKPGNILVTADGEPKIVDFGLAKIVAGESNELTASVTVEGTMAGTLPYMSPEQAAGDLARLDTRSDVYSLGVILYEQVTGRLPHVLSESSFDLQHRIIHTSPPSPRHINRRINRELETLILKAIRSNPSERYATAAELADDLRRYQRGDPLHAQPLTLAYVMRKRLAQHKTRVATAVLLILLLLGASGYAYVRIAVERDRAEAHARQTERTLYQHRLLLAQSEIEQGNISHALELLDACPEPLRHWEWHYLRHQADNSEHTIHASGSRLVAIAIDSKQGVARTLTRDGQLEGWELGTGKPVVPRTHSIRDVELAAFSQGGDTLLVYRNNQFHLFDAQTGARRKIVPWDGAQPIRLAGNSTGSRWAIVDYANQLTLISAPDGEALWSVTLPGPGMGLVFNNQDELAVAAANQFAWLPSVGATPPDIAWRNGSHSDARIEALEFNSTGDKLATGNQRGMIQIWQRDTDKPLASFSASSQHRITALTFDSSGQRLISTAMDSVLTVWHWPTSQQAGLLRGHLHDVRWLKLCPVRQTLISGNAWNTLKFWNIDEITANPLITNLAGSAAFALLHLEHQAGNTYAVGVNGDTTHIWQVKEGGLKPLVSDLPPAIAAAINERGDQVAVAGVAGVQIRPLYGHSRTPNPIRYLPAANVGALTFCAQDRFLLGTTPRGLTVWDTYSGDKSAEVSGRVLAASDDRDGWVLASDQEHHGEMFDRNLSGLRMVEEGAFPTHLSAFIVSPDGQKMAAASESIVFLWDANNGEVRRWLPFGDASVQRMCFTEDGQRLITAGPSVKLWNAATAEEMLTLKTDLPGPFYHVTFDQAQQAIIAGTANRIVRWAIR